MRRFLALLGLLGAAACTRDLTVRDPDASQVFIDAGHLSYPDVFELLDAGEIGVDGPGDPDTGLARDVGFAGDGGRGDVPLDPCIVDPFAVCVDNDESARSNDVRTDAFPLQASTAGCPSADNFVGADLARAGVMCALEPADWYLINLVGCDTRTFVLEAIVDFTPACFAEDLNLTVVGYPGGLPADPCTDPRVQCETSLGRRRMQLLIEPNSSSFFMYFGIEKVGANLGFGYDFRVIVR